MPAVQSTLLPPRTASALAAPRCPPLSGLLRIIALILVLGNLPMWIAQYYMTRPAAHDSLGSFLFGKVFKTVALMYPFLPPPEAEGEAARPPKIAYGLNSHPWDKVARTVVDVNPAPREWRTAYATEVEGVTSVERPGFMLSPTGARAQGAALAKEGEKIIMYIHGGAYIAGHPLMAPFPAKLALDTSLRVFGLQYRKCLDDGSAFPAPLLDALAGWRYLTVTLGFKPSDIVVLGVSAGGHLALALSSQLDVLGLPLPGGIALCSPWVDLTQSFPSWHRNTNDILCKPKLDLAVKSACRHYDVSARVLPFFSPAFAPAGHWRFLASVPVFISVGTAEAFEDEIDALAKGMRGDGVDVTVWRDPNGVHTASNLPLQSPKRFEGFRIGVEDLLQQMDIRAGGDGGN